VILAKLVEFAGTNFVLDGVPDVRGVNRVIQDRLSAELPQIRPSLKHFTAGLRRFLAALGDAWIELDGSISYRFESDARRGNRQFHVRVRVREGERPLAGARADDLQTLLSVARRPIPRLLPAPPREWVGRASERQRLLDFIADGTPGLTVVQGDAGSGKSSLLAKMCSDLAPRGRISDALDGLVYLPCQHVSGTPFQELAEALGEACGDLPRVTRIVNSGQSFAQQARALLLEIHSDRPIVIILDDLHALLRDGDLPDHGQLAVFIKVAATTVNNVRLIVGVQDAFALPWDVPDHRIQLGPLAVEEAAEYLRRTLLPPDAEADPPGLRAIAERERVSPMHLRSAVTFLASHPTYTLADLGGAREEAARAFAVHPDRRRIIERFIEQIGRLPLPEQRCLRALAVIDRPLSVNALHEMGILPDRTVPDALSPLLEWSEERTRLHSTVRDAAITCLPSEAADDADVHAAAGAYFARQPIPTTGAVLADTATLRYAAEHFIHARAPRKALEVVTTLDHHLRPAGQWEAIVRYRCAVQPLLEDREDQLLNLNDLGIPLARIGYARESVRTLLRARAIARRVRYVSGTIGSRSSVPPDRLAAARDAEVRALSNVGIAYTNMRFVTLARAAYERAVEIGEVQVRESSTADMRERVARRYRNLADACHRTGDLARARWCVLRARELSTPTEISQQGSFLARMGVIHLKEGNPFDARVKLQQSIEIASATGSKPDEELYAKRLGSLAEVWLHLSMHHLAHVAVDEAIAVFDRLGTAIHLVAMVERKAEIAQDSGDLAAAQILYERGRVLCRETRDYRGAVRQALLLTELGSPDATDALNESIRLCRWYLRFNPTMYTAWHALGVAQLAIGDAVAAWKAYEESLVISAAPGVVEEARRPLRWLQRSGIRGNGVSEFDARLRSSVVRSTTS
jgi:tetratricopeptide (TPR) repeat protein